MTRLEELPARIDALTSQVLQLREEMGVQFSGVRGDIQTGDDKTLYTLRDEIRAGDEETRRALGDEIRAGMVEVMTHARVLHEDQKAALALIAEGQRPRNE